MKDAKELKMFSLNAIVDDFSPYNQYQNQVFKHI